MAGYYLAPSLAVLRAEINARWPGRDKTSDGWIGDAAHQAQGSRSDHNPNTRGAVDALDVDRDGIDVYEVIAAVEQHPSSHYWIFNGLIADRDDGWVRRLYTGPNPHDKHLHVSIRQTRAAEQDTRPWGLVKEDDDMPSVEEIWSAAFGKGDNRRTAGQLLAEGRNAAVAAAEDVEQLRAEVAALRAEVATIKGEAQ